MSKYFSKADVKTISNFLTKILETPSAKKLNKTVKKYNDKSTFFNNMGLNELAKPISKRNGSVKKQSFTSSMNNTNSLNNQNSYGSYKPNNNMASGIHSYTSYSQGPYQTPSIKSTPYSGSNTSSYGVSQNAKSNTNPYTSNNNQQLGLRQATTTYGAQQQSLKPPAPKLTEGRAVSSVVQNNVGSNKITQPVVNSGQNAAQVNTNNQMFNYLKIPAFKYNQSVEKPKVVFLDKAGKPVDSTKWTPAQIQQAAKIANTKNPTDALVYVNAKNQVVPKTALTGSFAPLLVAINTENKNRKTAQEAAYKIKSDANTAMINQKTNAWNARMQQAMRTGNVPPELARYLNYSNVNFSNANYNTSSNTSNQTQTFDDFMNGANSNQ